MLNTYKLSIASVLLVLLVSQSIALNKDGRDLAAATTKAPTTTKATTTKAPVPTTTTTKAPTTTTTTTTTLPPSVVLRNNFKSSFSVNSITNKKGVYSITPSMFNGLIQFDGDNSRFRFDVNVTVAKVVVEKVSISYNVITGDMRIYSSIAIPTFGSCIN